jgi:hypothetical protein
MKTVRCSRHAALLLIALTAGQFVGFSVAVASGPGRDHGWQRVAESDAPPPSGKIRFTVQSASMRGDREPLTGEAMLTLTDILTSRGAELTHTPDWLLVIGTKELPNDAEHRIVLAISTMRTMPNEAIDFGKRAEMFYLGMSSEKRAVLPADGKWVREMVSEEMLRQYGVPVNQEIMIVERSRTKGALLKFAEEFLAKSGRAPR